MRLVAWEHGIKPCVEPLLPLLKAHDQASLANVRANGTRS
jgi:hypothetical protein